MADVSARPPQTGRLVEDDAGLPVARDGEHAAPAVGDRDVTDLRKDRVQRRGQVLDGVLGHPAIDVGAGGIPVWHAAPSNGDPVVDGALRVEEAVRGIAYGFAA